MKKLTLTTELALWLDGKELIDNKTNLEYRINTSTFKRDGKQVVLEMTVDAYIDNEWEEEFSNTLHIGDILDPQFEPWLMPL